jgi:hypothetical protein
VGLAQAAWLGRVKDGTRKVQASVLLCPKSVLKQLAHPQDGRAGWPENPVAIPLYVFLSEIKEQLIKIRRGPKRGKYCMAAAWNSRLTLSRPLKGWIYRQEQCHFCQNCCFLLFFHGEHLIFHIT